MGIVEKLSGGDHLQVRVKLGNAVAELDSMKVMT